MNTLWENKIKWMNKMKIRIQIKIKQIDFSKDAKNKRTRKGFWLSAYFYDST